MVNFRVLKFIVLRWTVKILLFHIELINVSYRRSTAVH